METDLGKMNVVVKDELEVKFRKAVFETYGMKKGNIQIAVEEAMKNWIEKQSKKENKK